MEMASHTVIITNTVIIIRNTRLRVRTPQTPPPFEQGVAMSSCLRSSCKTSLLYLCGYLGPRFVLFVHVPVSSGLQAKCHVSTRAVMSLTEKVRVFTMSFLQAGVECY